MLRNPNLKLVRNLGFRWVPSPSHHTQSVFIICRCHVCKFTCSLKFICKPRINTVSAFTVTRRHAQEGKKLESPLPHLPSGGRRRWCSASWFQLSYWKQVSFLWSLRSHAFCISVLFVDFPVLNGPQASLLKCCVVFLSAGRFRCASRRK